MINFIQTNATSIIAFLTLLSNIIFVGVLVVMLIHAGTRARLSAFVHKYILELLFWAVASAVVGSLVYSQIVGFPPCDLCWWQRIFMYPQVIILFVAMRRKTNGVLAVRFSPVRRLAALAPRFSFCNIPTSLFLSCLSRFSLTLLR
jgi:hypothetical protein